MLPVAGIGAIVMPWLIGVIADRGSCDRNVLQSDSVCWYSGFSVLILKYQAKN